MMTMLPVSATAMLAPEMPISAFRNLVRSLPRANLTSLGMSGVWPSSTSLLKTSATCSLVMWMAGITMCDGRCSGELDDPLAQVGLAHLDAGLFQMGVEVDLLRGHGLGFDDALDAVLLRELENVLVHLGGIAGAENLGAAGLGVLA